MPDKTINFDMGIAGGKWTIRTQGFGPLGKFLSAVRRRSNNFQPFLESAVLPEIRKTVTQVFKQMGTQKFAWPGVTPAYAKKKNYMFKKGIRRGPKKIPVKYGAKTIGKQTGTLFTALTRRNSFGNVCIINPTHLTWGVNPRMIPYAESFMRTWPVEYLTEANIRNLTRQLPVWVIRKAGMDAGFAGITKRLISSWRTTVG